MVDRVQFTEILLIGPNQGRNENLPEDLILTTKPKGYGGAAHNKESSNFPIRRNCMCIKLEVKKYII